MATLERWLLQDGVRWIAVFVLTLVALGALVVRRKLMMVEGWGIMYEDQPAPDVQTLGLRD
jgi:hypothetical protein